MDTITIDVDNNSVICYSVLTTLKHINLNYKKANVIYKKTYIDMVCFYTKAHPLYTIRYDITKALDYKAYKTLHKFI